MHRIFPIKLLGFIFIQEKTRHSSEPAVRINWFIFTQRDQIRFNFKFSQIDSVPGEPLTDKGQIYHSGELTGPGPRSAFIWLCP